MSDGEKTKKAKVQAGEEAVSGEKAAADIPSFPMKGAKNKAKGAPPAAKKIAAKKAKTGDDVTALVNSADPKSFVRQRISKDFDGETYFGTIMEYDDKESPPFWHVEYDDGDEEDFSKKDLIRALKHYEVNGKKDTNKS